jgi:hypothetical protein
MNGLTLSLIVGFLLAYSSVWLVSRINDRYTQWEKNLCRVLIKRGKKDLGRDPDSNPGVAVLQTVKSWIINRPDMHFAPQSFLQRGRAILSAFSGHSPSDLFKSIYLGCVRLRKLPSSIIRKEACPMTAYEFYWKDREGREHFLGTLPERRKIPERITRDSIEKWGKLIIGEWAMINNFYFIQVKV